MGPDANATPQYAMASCGSCTSSVACLKHAAASLWLNEYAQTSPLSNHACASLLFVLTALVVFPRSYYGSLALILPVSSVRKDVILDRSYWKVYEIVSVAIPSSCIDVLFRLNQQCQLCYISTHFHVFPMRSMCSVEFR